MQRSYGQITGFLEDLAGMIEDARDSGDPKWALFQGVGMIREAADIISDYEMVVEENLEYQKRYAEETAPLYECGVMICPECHHRVKDNYTHCHHCGKKLGWPNPKKKVSK